MAGGEIPPGTVLTSASTRTPGVVANFDIAPTVLAHLGLGDTTGTMIGAPVAGVAGSAKDVDRAFEALAGSAATRSPLLNAYLRYVQLVVLGSLLWVGRAFWRRYSLGRTAGEPEPGSGKYFLVSLAVLPFVFLLGPLCGSLGLPAATLLYAGLALFLTALLTRIRSHAALFLTLGLFNLGPILVDVVRGSPLMRSAVLGFNPLAGGRFYGIGNEYMGVLLGAALLAGAAFAGWRRERKNLQLVAVLFYAALVYFLAAPNLGANAGGTVAAAAAFGAAVLWPCLGKRKTGWKTWLLLLGVFCLLGMTALVGLNLFLPFEVRSHVARVTELLLSGNLAPVWEILARKAEANWHLLTRSPWGTTRALQLLLLVAILVHSRQEVRRLGEERPLFTGGLAGLGVGALVALLCNDSGVTAACTMLVFLLVPLFWTLFVPGGEDLVNPLAVSATARKG